MFLDIFCSIVYGFVKSIPGQKLMNVWEARGMKKRDLTSLDRATTSLTLRSITSSTWTNHFSTAPLASDVEICLMSGTRSPSLLYMA